jgi:hypothetical protein
MGTISAPMIKPIDPCADYAGASVGAVLIALPVIF